MTIVSDDRIGVPALPIGARARTVVGPFIGLALGLLSGIASTALFWAGGSGNAFGSGLIRYSPGFKLTLMLAPGLLLALTIWLILKRQGQTLVSALCSGLAVTLAWLLVVVLLDHSKWLGGLALAAKRDWLVFAIYPASAVIGAIGVSIAAATLSATFRSVAGVLSIFAGSIIALLVTMFLGLAAPLIAMPIWQAGICFTLTMFMNEAKAGEVATSRS